MKRYPSSTPRAAFALGAFALTVLTFGLAVVAPSQTSASLAGAPLAVASPAPVATRVVVTPGRVDVIAVRPALLAQDRAAPRS